MENNSLISVVVPAYNEENHIRYCMESILNQTYKNLEIIIVDDGSTDSTGKICDEYVKKDSRIKVIHQKNGGLSDARNNGMKLATSKYIGFVDSDDFLHPNFYETMYNLMVENDGDLVECELLRINIDDVAKAQEILDDNNSKVKKEIKVLSANQALNELFGAKLKSYVNTVLVSNKLYKRELFENTIFPVGKLHEDEFTTYKIIDKCKKVISINQKLYGYIQTKNSIMRKEISTKRIDDSLCALEGAINYFKANKNEEIEIKAQRRYLEICVELSGKIANENSIDKNEKLSKLNSSFRTQYEEFFKDKELKKIDDIDKPILEMFEDAYYDNKNDCIPPVYWNRLEKYINEI